MEDAKILETIDELLHMASECESCIETLDHGLDDYRQAGIAEVDFLIARKSLREASQALEGMAVAIKLVSEHEGRIAV